ncbi:DUF2059 domain-containing protein [Arenibacterium sp. LLYu02]|uniref:DUF2059 domain-containing protein n=1 Tax=Arenibacterium sp. LLYu02 TaxID=3404132 RepID=UPI003B224AF0
MSPSLVAPLRPAFTLHSMLSRLLAAVLGLSLLFSGAARAAERDQIRAFLEVTGFDVALDSIAQSAGDAPAMLGAEASDFGLEWERLTAKVFDTTVMRDMAVDILEQTLSQEALFHAAEFYASDLGQRLVVAENASHIAAEGLDTHAEGERIVADLVAAGDEKVALYQDMNTAIGGTDSAIRAIQDIQYRFLMAAAAAGVIELQLDSEGLLALMREQAEEMRTQLAASSLANSAYTYRDFSTEEVTAYVEALKQPLMQEVYELLNAVQYEIQANRFEELAHQMRDLQPVQDL